tara:strand:+ start:1858 stop:2421 length:564 start_codon:yes stop_codon:yes gene_type:complete
MASPSGLLLTHGAGSDRNHSILVSIEKKMTPLPVKRINFPYRKAGRPFPDRPPKLINSIVKASESMSKKYDLEPSKLLLGGRSMGGRMCSMAVAEGLPAIGLILISYPLHPPKKPENLRTEHFDQLDIPCLFISGDKDPFGSKTEFKKHLKKIRGPVTIKWFEGARHDLANLDEAVSEEIKAWSASL